MDFIYLYKERYEGRTVMADDFQCDCFAESKRCHSSVTDEKVRREIVISEQNSAIVAAKPATTNTCQISMTRLHKSPSAALSRTNI